MIKNDRVINTGRNYFRTSTTSEGDITSNFVDLNKKIADKLKQNVNRILKIFDQPEEKVEIIASKEMSDKKKENIFGKEDFKIELPLREEEVCENLIEEDSNKSLNKKRRIEPEENNVNKFIKSKWKETKRGFTSKDGIQMRLKNSDFFKKNEMDEEIEYQKIINKNTTEKVTENKMLKEEEVQSNSDSDIEIPDLI